MVFWLNCRFGKRGCCIDRGKCGNIVEYGQVVIVLDGVGEYRQIPRFATTLVATLHQCIGAGKYGAGRRESP